MSTYKYVLIGGGKMGGALLKGWRASSLSAKEILVVETNKEAARALTESYQVTVMDHLPEGASPEVIIFAIKPQILPQILPSYDLPQLKKTLFISIAAGKTLAFFSRYLGEEAALIRAMPNLPATVQQAMTVLLANPKASASQKETAEWLFGMVGKTFWASQEAEIDVITALSGSGPAYLFLLAEMMIKIAKQKGIPPEFATLLVHQTLYGSSVMLEETKVSAENLRQQVTSPNGTTEAALNTLLKENRFEYLMQEAIEAAIRRSRELAE